MLYPWWLVPSPQVDGFCVGPCEPSSCAWACVCQRYLFFFPRLLLELLELLFDKFNAVATAHSVVLGYLQDTVVTPLAQQEDVKLYDMADVWMKIQDVLQVKGPFTRGAISIQNNRLERNIYHLRYSLAHKQ